jgi:starch synthase (maltosyl-transferring)
VAVNLDTHYRQSGWVRLASGFLGDDDGRPYQIHDMLTGARYIWQGSRNYIELDPALGPAQIFRVRRKVRTEREFEYYL